MEQQPITSKQQFWRDHLLAAQSSGLTYTQYAKKHDLNVKSLYSWSMMLRRKGLLEQSMPAFMEAEVARPPIRSAGAAGARV